MIQDTVLEDSSFIDTEGLGYILESGEEEKRHRGGRVRVGSGICKCIR